MTRILHFLISLSTICLLNISAHAVDFTDGKDHNDKEKESAPATTPVEVAAAPPLNSVRDFEDLETLSSLVFEPHLDPIRTDYVPDLAVANDVQRATELFDLVVRENRLTDFLTDGSLQSLPVGINKTIGGKQYIIVIDSMVLTPTAAYLVAYMSLPIPQSDQRLSFKASNIRFTKTGGLTGAVKLTLLEDISIPVGNNAQINILSEGGETFIDWDCNGFKSLGMNAEVEFSRDYLVPDNDDGSAGEGRVTGNFKTVVNDWNDLVAEISLSPFQVAKLEGFGFYVSNAVFDFSDLNNAPSVVFPEGYESTLMTEANPELWQGFYLKEIAIKLPPQFSSENGGRKQLEGYDLIIDNMGFTGLIVARNLLSLEEGSMNGWAFSLDSIGVSVMTNEITQAGFNGQLQVPVFKEDQLFSYSTVITSENEYFFTVANEGTLQMSLLAASAEIYESSYLEITIIDGEFKPKAVLNGKLTINSSLSSDPQSSGGAQASLADLTFEELEISTVEPYITVGAFSLGSEAVEQTMANLPIGLQEIELSGTGNQISLSFDIVVNLVGQNSGGFGARGGLRFNSEMDFADGKMSFAYKGVEVSEMTIDIDGGAFKLNGSLILFKDDATYGNGIKGTVEAFFQPGIKVQAVALFGTVAGMRYWYADAMASFKPGLMVFTGFGIYGFGGGAYYHMKQAAFDEEAGSDIGASSSGIVYVPDPDTYIGVKATISLGTHPTPEAFNGDATLEISFNDRGGVNSIIFTGNAYFAAPPIPPGLANLKNQAKLLATATGQESPFDDSKGSIQAKLHIQFDVPNLTLHGNLRVYVTVGGGVIKGAGADNLAGEAVMHFSPDEWYIHIGTPENRIALNMVGFFTMQGYMMVGQNIPAMPAPPSNVTDILGEIDMDRSDELEKFSTGEGFAFGASFSYSTGDMRFLMFYGRFDAGAGFDIMLKNYGENARCEGSTEPIGIGGWYATGQAYAYFQGKIGITIDLAFYSGDFEILNIAAAALLRAKLPNPVYLQGTIGGRYSILNGLVSGSCNFQITVGEECRIQGAGALEGVEMIAEVTPRQDDEAVSVFTAAQAVFNMAMDQTFEITDSENNVKYFRGHLAEFKLLDEESEIPGTLDWNADRTVVAFNPIDILPSAKKIRVKVKINFEERKYGVWVPVYYDGQPASEERNVTFTSGIAPDYIPLSNVQYSYPLIDQYNFYPQESNKGYIKLVRGMPGLFNVSADWKQVGRFSTANGQKLEFDFTYANQQINFSIPGGFNNSTIYTFDIINVPLAQQQAVDANVQEQTAQVGGEGTGVELRTRSAEGSLEVLQEKSIFSTFVRTSQHNRFLDKLSSLTTSDGAMYPLYPDIHQLLVRLEGGEVFDKYEIKGGGENFARLVQLEADLTNRWYAQNMGPLIYQGYPYPDAAITYREADKLGVPPFRAISIGQSNADQLLTDVEKQSNFVVGTDGYASVQYNFIFQVYQDYYHLRQRAAYLSQFRSEPWLERIMTGQFMPALRDTYRVKVKYVLPGINETTSESLITIRI